MTAKNPVIAMPDAKVATATVRIRRSPSPSTRRCSYTGVVKVSSAAGNEIVGATSDIETIPSVGPTTPEARGGAASTPNTAPIALLANTNSCREGGIKDLVGV